MNSRQRAQRSRGMTLVESALLLPLCLLLTFLIIEAGRLLSARAMLDNAVRDGARLASVSTTTLVTQDIQTDVMNRFSGNAADSIQVVSVYKADQASGKSLGPWTDAARGDCIAVEATLSHQVVLPSFGLLPTTMTLHGKSVIPSEGN